MEYLPFFLVLLASVLFALAFRRFHLPWVLSLTTAGVVIGPYGFEFAEVTPTISFLSEIGLIFLMFMAGLETKMSSFKAFRTGIAWLAAANGLIPLAVGFLLGYVLGFPTIASLLLGTIFMSSSIAVIVPTLEANGLIHKKLGKSIVASTLIVDVASLILLSVLLQSVEQVTSLPLPSFYIIVTLIVVGFAYILPKIRNLIPHYRDEKDLFESEVRIIFALLIGVVVTFELLGLHPIIAGFFAGLVLSESIKSEIVIDKLRTISYGIFIPVFFVVIGMETDLGTLVSDNSTWWLILAIVSASVFSKLGSGWLGARLSGFNKSEALTVGVSTIPQLSTTLAVVFAGVELNILPAELVTAMVVLSIITTLIAPLWLRKLHPNSS